MEMQVVTQGTDIKTAIKEKKHVISGATHVVIGLKVKDLTHLEERIMEDLKKAQAMDWNEEGLMNSVLRTLDEAGLKIKIPEIISDGKGEFL